MKKTIITILTFFFFVSGYAQSPLQKRIDFSVEEVQIKDALRRLSIQTGVSIAFSSSFFDRKKRITLHLEDETIDFVISQILKNTNASYQAEGSQIIVSWEKPQRKRRFTISGFVEDQSSGERLIAVTIFSPKYNLGTTSNEYGFYSLTLPEGSTELFYKYVGCQEVRETINLTKDVEKTVVLEASALLSEVVVLSNQNQLEIESIVNDNNKTLENLNEMPVLGRGGDLLKKINFLPGVESGTEGLGGFFVRGGNIDQNLTLMDGVSIYNPSHLLGLFSVFDAEAIKSSKLYKGDFPARYGGRISSVLDVRMKDGNNKEYSGEISPGFLSSRITLEGPLKKGKVGFFTTFRSSAIGVLSAGARRILKNNADPVPFLTFYDFNAKLHFEFSKKDKLFLSVYAGQDIFRINDEFGNEEYLVDPDSVIVTDSVFQDSKVNWGNGVFALRWNHLFNNKLFSNTTLTFSRFNFNFSNLEIRDETEADTLTSYEYDFLEFENYITDLGMKMDFDYIPSPKHYIRFGGSGVIHALGSGNTEEFIEIEDFDELAGDPDLEELAKQNQLEIERFAIDLALYVEDEINFSEKFKANLGLRISAFGNDQDKWYVALEPRLHANYLLSNNWSIKGSVTRNYQSLHLLTNTGLGLPVDVWVPSLEELRPQTSWQKSLAFQYRNSNSFKFQVEGFYKKMKHLIFLRKSIFQFESLTVSDSTFITGEGTSYGMEVTLEKEWKNLFAFGYYTLSKSERFFPDYNLGNSFPFQYDRRHSIKLGALWNATQKMDVGFTWTYFSGTPRIYADIFADLEDFPDPQTYFPAGRYNQVRTPAYHRMDFKIQWTYQKSYGAHQWGVNIYNLYYQKNVTYYDEQPVFDQNGNFIGSEIAPTSIAPIIPSFYYSFQF